jgi:sugar phosphate isomerase/epimerase
MTLRRPAPRQPPLGTGFVDLPRLLATLRQVGYDGWISVEDFPTGRPLD